MKAAKEDILVITADLKLYHYALSTGIDIINFNHLRTANW